MTEVTINYRGKDLEFETEWEPMDTVKTIIDEKNGKVHIHYYTDDNDGYYLADTEDLADEDREGGQLLFEIYRRNSKMSANEFGGIILDKFKNLNINHRDLWEAFLNEDYIDGENAINALKNRKENPVMICSEGQVDILLDGNIEYSCANEEEIQEFLSELDDKDISNVSILFNGTSYNDDFLTVLYSDNKELPLFMVECYEHGNIHYSCVNTMNYPDRRWDVGTAGYFIPPEHLLESYKEGKCSLEEIHEISNSYLDTYSDWRNGNLYCLVSEEFNVYYIGDTYVIEQKESNICGGFIGHENVEDEMYSEIAGSIFSIHDNFEDNYLDKDAPHYLKGLRYIVNNSDDDELRKHSFISLIVHHNQQHKDLPIFDGLNLKGIRLTKNDVPVGFRTISNLKIRDTDFSELSCVSYLSENFDIEFKNCDFENSNKNQPKM